MRKIWLLAIVAAVSVWSLAHSADKPIYSIWSPTYRAGTPQEFRQASIDIAKMEDEARTRKLLYALIGMVGLFAAIVVFQTIISRRRRIDAAFVGSLASIVSAKRRLGRKIEAHIDSKTKPPVD